MVAVFRSKSEVVAQRPIDPTEKEIGLSVFKIPTTVETDEKTAIGLPFNVDIAFRDRLWNRAFIEKCVGPVPELQHLTSLQHLPLCTFGGHSHKGSRE